MQDSIHILIVEDSLTQAIRLRYILEHSGYQVTVAHDGRQALAALAQSLPTIVISDVIMPEMDGYALCRQMKIDARYQHIPVILLTALGEPDDVFKALQAGADNFITKPYESHALLSSLRRIIDNLEMRRRQDADAQLEVHFAGQQYALDISRTQVVDFLISTYENALRKNSELDQKNRELDQKNQQLKDALENIKTLQAKYRQLLETSVDAVVVADAGGVVRYANPAANALLANTACPLEGAILPFEMTAGACIEVALASGTDEPVVAEMRVVETDWDGENANLAVLRDITAHVAMREKLQQLSLNDELTGLYNRRGFLLVADQVLKQASREHRALFLMYIDLDGMKQINDRFGHQEGDSALCDMATALGATFRKTDVIGRLGGDEFAVFGFIEKAALIVSLEERVQQALDAKNATGQRKYCLAASIGTIYHPAPASATLDTLMKHADARMYERKRARKTQVGESGTPTPAY